MRLILNFLLILCMWPAYAQPMFSDSLLDASGGDNRALFEKLFKTIERPKVAAKSIKGAAVLENGYALSKIKNPEVWEKLKDKNMPTQVEIVYTKYPKDKEFWLTDYDILLADRLREIFAVDARLNDKKIKYFLVLQTACETDEEARAMFHGVVIRYRAKTAEEIKKDKESVKKEEGPDESVPGMPGGYSTIKRFIKNCGGMYDSIVYKVLNRHWQSWKDLAIVCDWTASNYQYAAQSVIWHMEHIKDSPVRTYTFFNDGDELYEGDKKIGSTGGLYYADAAKTSKIVSAFNASMRKGLGGDIPENDAEALIKTLEKFPDTKSIVLIADNSPFRDFELASSIKMPVHIILQGTEWGINPQYINLAYITGGSIHTAKRDYNSNFFARGDSSITMEDQTFILDPVKNLYTCENLAMCESLDRKIYTYEEELYTELSKKSVYRGMHKDKRPSGFTSLMHWIFGK